MGVLDLFRLDGKRALVTGCKRSIGRAMALTLAEAGADIIGVSKSLETRDSDIERKAAHRGSHFKVMPVTFADREELHGFISRVQEDVPRIDILVNKAGHILRAPASEHPESYWDEIIETNLSTQFLLSQAIGKHMLANNAGKIIFTALLLTFQSGITVPGYAASKGAPLANSQNLWRMSASVRVFK